MTEQTVERVAVHEPDCDRRRCGCIGLVAEVTGRSESVMGLRLAFEDETAGGVTLMVMGDLLLMVAGAAHRVSITGDWASYHRWLMEILVRESARLADERGLALATAASSPVLAEVLAEQGFRPVGALMRRDVQHGLRRTPESGVDGDRVAWCVCGAERRAEKLGDAHAAVLAHVAEALK